MKRHCVSPWWQIEHDDKRKIHENCANKASHIYKRTQDHSGGNVTSSGDGAVAIYKKIL